MGSAANTPNSFGAAANTWRYAAALLAALLSVSVIQAWTAPASANTTGNGVVVQDLTFTSQPALHHVDGTDRVILASGSTVQIWSTAGVLLHTLTNIGNVTDIASSGNSVALVAHGDNAVVIVNASTGTETARVSGITDVKSDIAIEGNDVWWLARKAGTDPAVPDGNQPFEIVHFSLANTAAQTTLPAPGMFADGGTLQAIPGDASSVIFHEPNSSGYWRIFTDGSTPVQSAGASYWFSGFDDSTTAWFWALDISGHVVKVSLANLTIIPGSASARSVASFPFETTTDGASNILYTANGPDFHILPAATPAQRQRLTLSGGAYNASDISPTQIFTVWSKQLGQSGWTGSVHKLVIADRSLATAFPFPTTTTTTTTVPTTTTTVAPTTTTTIPPTTTTTEPPTPTFDLNVLLRGHGLKSNVLSDATLGCDNSNSNHRAYGRTYTFTFVQWGYCGYYKPTEAPRGTFIRPDEDAKYIRTTSYTWPTEKPANINAVIIDYYASAFTDLQQFIFEQYEVVLHRQPTTPEFNYWWDQIVYKEADEANIAISLMASAEFANKVRPVSRLYLAYFDRWSDRGGEAYWVNLHRGGHHLNQISNHFASSEEFQLTYGSLSNQAFVELIYRNVLRRTADAGGVSYWTSFLDAGRISRGELMVQFSESPEFRALTDAEIAIRSIVFGEVELEPAGQFLADRAADYRSTGGDLRNLITQLLASQAYHDKFYWNEPSAGLTNAAAQHTSDVTGSTTTPPALDSSYTGDTCVGCPDFDRK